MSRHIDSNRVQCYVDELLVLKLRMAEIRVLELEKELAAASAPKNYCSKLVQAEIASPKPPNCSKLVQAQIASPKPSNCSKRVQTDSDAPPPPNWEPFVPVVNTSTKPPNCSKESKLVQVELESPKPSNSSCEVQCTLLNPDIAKAEVEKRDEEKKGSVNVKDGDARGPRRRDRAAHRAPRGDVRIHGEQPATPLRRRKR